MDWNLQNIHGFTCAIIAAKEGKIEILKILKDIRNVNWNLTTLAGESALSEALKNNNMEAVKIILSVPSIEIDADQLKRQNIPRDTMHHHGMFEDGHGQP